MINMKASNSTLEFLNRNCPSCGNIDRSAPVISTKPAAESMSFEQVKNYWSGFFKEKAIFSYYRCTHCQLLYCPTFFTEQQLQMLYECMSDNTAGVNVNALVKTQRDYFQLLKPYLSLQGSYLEFGPDIGLFTEHCVQEAQYDHYWLLEPNQNVWQQLGQKVPEQKRTLFTHQHDIANIPNGSLSTVVMIHVLDHLLDPLSLLKNLKKKLTANAVLAFVTHDESSLLAKVIKTKWAPYCLQHPQLFNPTTIASLLQEAGYKTLNCSKTYNHFPVTYLIKHVLWLAGIKNINLPALPKLQLPLKLGNIMTVATPQ